MLCSTRDIPAKNVRLRRALITRIGGINLATMFNSPARPHTYMPAMARRLRSRSQPVRRGVPPRHALIRTWDKKLFLYHHATCACTLSPLPRVNLRMINVITYALRPVVYRELYGVAWRVPGCTHVDIKHRAERSKDCDGGTHVDPRRRLFYIN